MPYAQITDDQIQAVGSLPRAARTLTDGRWVKVREGTEAEQHECGWFEVVDTERPADTATTTHDRTIELVDGTPTVVWTERPKTQDELDAETQQANDEQLRTAVRNHLADLRTIRDSTGNLSAAQASNALRALAKGQIHVIRLLVGALDGTE